MAQQHKQLIELQAERDKLQDEAAGLTKDDIVDQARIERDDAIAKYVLGKSQFRNPWDFIENLHTSWCTQSFQGFEAKMREKNAFLLDK